MSRPAQIIEVTPPDHCFVTKEKTVLTGFVCPNCGGKKEFVDQTGPSTYATKQCFYCGGTGKVEAEVEITWRSSDK